MFSTTVCALVLVACGSKTLVGYDDATTDELGDTGSSTAGDTSSRTAGDTSSRTDGEPATGDGSDTTSDTGSLDPSIAIEPSFAELHTLTNQSFSAMLNHIDDPSVSWAVVEPNGGEIDSSGNYSAPRHAGTFRVRATSSVDSALIAEATVIVRGRGGKSDGFVARYDEGSATAHDAVMDIDGTVYVVGTHYAPIVTPVRMFLSKIHPEAGLDLGFGTNGLLRIASLTTGTSHGSALHMPAPGTLLSGGSGNTGQMMLARSSTSGQLDASFGTGGVLQTTEIPTVHSLSGTTSNRIVAAVGTPAGAAIRLFEANGTPVPDFGDAGVSEAVIPSEWQPIWATSTYITRDIIVQDDGKILVLGVSRPPGYTVGVIVVARLTPSGELDTSFGVGGAYLHWKDGVAAMDANTFLRLDDGRIMIGGRSGSYFVIGRLHPNGTRDETFGDEGWVQHMYDRNLASPLSSRARGIQALPDGHLVVVCRIGSQSGLLRLRENGEVDLDFGDGVGDGWGLVGHPSLDYEFLEPIALFFRPPNRLVVVGTAEHQGYSSLAVYGAYAW